MKKIYIETFNDNQFKYREESDPDFQVRPKNYKLVKEVDYDAQSFKLNLIDCFTKETLFRGKSVDSIYVDGSNYTDIDSLNDAISPLIFKKGGGSGGGGADLTLEQARQNGNVLEGSVLFNSSGFTAKLDADSLDIGFIISNSNEDNTAESKIIVGSNNILFEFPSNSDGLLSTNYYGDNADDLSWIQKKYVDDRFTNSATELVSADYGTTTNILKSTQFYTTEEGSGITTVTLDSSIPLNSIVFISDAGNMAEMNNIVVDAGSGSTILEGDGGAPMQTMTIDSSGLSYTLKKLSSVKWMVVGTNQ